MPNPNMPGIENQPIKLDQQRPVSDPFAFDRTMAAASYGLNLMAPAGVAALYNAGNVGGAQILSAGVNGMAVGPGGQMAGMGGMAPYGLGGSPVYGSAGVGGLVNPIGGGNDPLGQAEANLNSTDLTFSQTMGLQMRMGRQTIMYGALSQVEKAKHDTESQITRNI